jgi:hypothetical protein
MLQPMSDMVKIDQSLMLEFLEATIKKYYVGDRAAMTPSNAMLLGFIAGANYQEKVGEK